MIKRNYLVLLLSAIASTLFPGDLFAQYSPKPEFKGKVGKTEQETQQWYREKLKAPGDAPNVIWILLDDAGFAASSPFGGQIQTPTFEEIANRGLKYTNFHNVGVCSPTRAALLTGRNSHAVGFGYFASNETTPGYNGLLPFETATIAEILKENGYNTFAVGKWHVLPNGEDTQAGPFNRWPLGRGFEQFYGFLGGATDQWHPELWEGNTKTDVGPNPKHLTTLLADKAITYIANQKSANREKPFFLYFAPGATHSPHQAPQEWIDKFKGKFDQGWDAYRDEIFQRQIKLGIIPKNTTLPPRDPQVKAWSTLSAEQKKLYTRFMEVYAAYLAHTDYEIGRIVSYLKNIDQYDNTLILAVLGDNGGTRRGSEHGTLNEAAYIPKTAEEKTAEFVAMTPRINEIGSETTYPVYPEGWGQADNTPFRYWKYDANGEGGTHTPLIVSYPKKIKSRGIRAQYGHVIDLLPTTVALTGARIPDQINGYKQEPVQGIDLSYSIEEEKAVSKRTTQYYEIAGNRGIFKDGWKAHAYHQDGKSFENDKWELFNIDNDWSEAKDLASTKPEKLAELKEAFHQEALKYNIYPLHGRTYKAPVDPHEPVETSKEIYPGTARIQPSEIPNLLKGQFTITAYGKFPTNAEGVLFAEGGKHGGISLYFKQGKLHLSQSDGTTDFHLVSDQQISAGESQIRVQFSPDATTQTGGLVSLYLNNSKVAEGRITTHPFKRNNYNAGEEGIELGKDSNTPIANTYNIPFPLNGELKKVVFETANQSL